MTGKTIRTHVYFTGRVQGVFFRANTRNKANELAIHGWVRNLADGRVEAIFQGPGESVNSIIRWCKHSIPRARVISIDVKEEELKKTEGFEIIR